MEPRKLPVSNILVERKEQIVQLIQNWDTDLEAQILAENFYLDQSREDRMAAAKDALEKAGAIESIDEVEPENQLRGSFKMNSENGTVRLYFTLTPEKYPKVQRLNISFRPKKK